MTDEERIINRLQILAIEKCLNMENCQDIADVYEKHFCKKSIANGSQKGSEQANQPTRTGNQGAVGGCMDAEKAFMQFWGKRWSFTSSNEKVLSLSANFRNTKEAFLAGWEASGNTEQLLQPDTSGKKEN